MASMKDGTRVQDQNRMPLALKLQVSYVAVLALCLVVVWTTMDADVGRGLLRNIQLLLGLFIFFIAPLASIVYSLVNTVFLFVKSRWRMMYALLVPVHISYIVFYFEVMIPDVLGGC